MEFVIGYAILLVGFVLGFITCAVLRINGDRSERRAGGYSPLASDKSMRVDPPAHP